MNILLIKIQKNKKSAKATGSLIHMYSEAEGCSLFINLITDNRRFFFEKPGNI